MYQFDSSQPVTSITLAVIFSLAASVAAQAQGRPPPPEDPAVASTSFIPPVGLGRGSESRAQEFSDVPASEISLGRLLPTVPSHDLGVAALGNGEGEIALLTWESYALKSAYSGDGGANFSPEVVVDGGPGGLPAAPSCPALASWECGYWEVVQGSDGTLHLAYTFGDDEVDVGMRYSRSDDMGQTWTMPVDLVAHGADSHGVNSTSTYASLAANGSGVIAAVYAEMWEGRDSYVTVSTDWGETWTSPTRLDQGDTGNVPSFEADVLVDPFGNIHAVFVQDRGWGNRVWYTRSTDGGTSFSAEINFDSLGLSLTDSRLPVLHHTSDGKILVAFWNPEQIITVETSDGMTFSHNFTYGLSTLHTPTTYRFFQDPSSATVLTAWVDSLGLHTRRSGSNGSAWEFDNRIATNAGNFDVVRTESGNWAVAWEDSRDASTGAFGYTTDIYVKVSMDDGVSWGAEQRADRDGAGSAISAFPTLAAAGSDGLFVAYVDARDHSGTATNVYANRSPAASLDFSANERRVDTDTWQDNLEQDYGGAVATDGVAHVYAAFAATATGPWRDIYVAASADGGRSYPLIQRASRHAAGTANTWAPQLSAHPDGTVYLTYLRYASGAFELVFSRSDDFGQNWLVTEEVLSTGVAARVWNDYRLVTLPDGKVYVVWTADELSGWGHIRVSHSLDRGDSFVTDVVDQSADRYNDYPDLCAQGDQVFVVFMAWTGVRWDVFAVTSDDAGASWNSRVSLRAGGAVNHGYYPTVACNKGTNAIAFWSDTRNGPYQLFTNRYDGSAWTGDLSVGGPVGFHHYVPNAVFLSESIAAVAYTDQRSCWISRTTDGGTTYRPYQRLDDTAPQPLADSDSPHLATDGLGNLWVTWVDESAGPGTSWAVRQSDDFGATLGPVYRVNREKPQGSRYNPSWPWLRNTVATLPEVAFFQWGGQRSSRALDNLVNAYDLNDFDRDEYDFGADCDDANNDVHPGAAEVNDGLDNQCPGDDGYGLVDEIEGVCGFHDPEDKNEFSWTAQTGATSYEAARSADPRFLSGCTTVTTPETYWIDTEPVATGACHHYLVRALAPHPGSWGAGFPGPERAGICP